MPDRKTSSSRSDSLYAGSLPFTAFDGFVGASAGQFAVVWMTDAPSLLACWRFCARAGDQRNVGSSKKPIGIFGAAWTVAAGAAKSVMSATSAKRVGFDTDRSSLLFPWARRPAAR